MMGGMGAVVAGITTDALNPVMPGAPKSDVPPVAGFGMVVPPVIDLKSDKPGSPPSAAAPDDMNSFKQKLEKLKMIKEADKRYGHDDN
jgi:hypothetical protein